MTEPIKPSDVKNTIRRALQKYGTDMNTNREEREAILVPMMVVLCKDYEFEEASEIYNSAMVEVLIELHVIPKREVN